MTNTNTHQHRATDPAASAWVSANAGTGKTYVLVRRVLRLLLAGASPDRILCLTFTKAAAAEMSNRLFLRLAAWATASQSQLADELAEILDRKPMPAEQAAARALFAAAIEAPGGLKVQTIHAFCERVLQRFPLEAGLSPGFTVLDADQQTALVRTSIDGVLEAANSGDRALGQALQTVVALAGESRFDTLLGEALKKRDHLDRLIKTMAAPSGAFEEIEVCLKRQLGAPKGATDATLTRDMLSLLPRDLAERIHAALIEGSVNDLKSAQRLADYLFAVGGQTQIKALACYLLTSKSEPFKNPMTRSIATAYPVLDQQINSKPSTGSASHSSSRPPAPRCYAWPMPPSSTMPEARPAPPSSTMMT